MIKINIGKTNTPTKYTEKEIWISGITIFKQTMFIKDNRKSYLIGLKSIDLVEGF